MTGAAWLLGALGSCCLALAKKRHRKEAVPSYKKLAESQIYSLQLAGWLLLMVAAAIMISAKGVALGLVYSLGGFMCVAMGLALLLSFRPRWTPWLAVLMIFWLLVLWGVAR